MRSVKPHRITIDKGIVLSDGTSVHLRLIRPDDVKQWLNFVKCCSGQSLRSRFFFPFSKPNEIVANRFCNMNPDTELGIVAEIIENRKANWIAIARLFTDSLHQEAEYALLVADAWQRKGLGTIMTQFSLEIAKKWGIKSVKVEIMQNNFHMIKILRNQNFIIRKYIDDELLMALVF